MKNFRDVASCVDDPFDPAKQQRVAMFCTGGIRCEEASAWLLARSFPEVYQLDGGVIKYLAQVAPDESPWQVECFVFDTRVAA